MPGADIVVGGSSVTVVPTDIVLAALAVGLVARIVRSRHYPRGAVALTACAGALAALIVLTGAANGTTALITSVKLVELATLLVASVVLVERVEHLWIVVVVLVGVNAVAVVWGVVGWAQNPGSRQASFLGEHEFAALSTASLVVGLAALHAGHRLGRLPLFAGIVGALGITLGAALASLLGLYIAGAVLVSLAAARSALRLRPVVVTVLVALSVTAGTYALRGSDFGFLTMAGAGQECPARPVRRQLESTADLLVHRRPRLPRASDPRDGLVGRAAAVGVRPLLPTLEPGFPTSRRGTSRGRTARSFPSRRTTRCCTSSASSELRRCSPSQLQVSATRRALGGTGRARTATRSPATFRPAGSHRSGARWPVRHCSEGRRWPRSSGSRSALSRAVAVIAARAMGGNAVVGGGSDVERPSLSVVHAIARLNVGGAALNLLGLAAEQRRRGHDVVVVAGTLAKGEASMEYVATELGVPVLHVPALQRELSVQPDLAAIRALRRIITTRRPDILHTHTAKAGATGRIGALLSGRARPRGTVHTFHGHVLRGYFGPYRERVFVRVEWLLARMTGAVVTVSDEVRDDLVALGVAPRDKIAVIPYGFDLSQLGRPGPAERDRGRAEIGIGPDAFVVGWVGRLTPIKRPEDLIRTLAQLVENGVDAALVAIGDGPDRPAVEALAARLGVAERCHLVGYQQHMSHWYGLFDAFVLTSENEGTPVAAIEALASGCPVVATDAGGTATVVRNGETGYIVPIGDTAALASHLTDLALRPELARELGSRGAVDVRERFAMAQMVDRIDELYARC